MATTEAFSAPPPAGSRRRAGTRTAATPKDASAEKHMNITGNECPLPVLVGSARHAWGLAKRTLTRAARTGEVGGNTHDLYT